MCACVCVCVVRWSVCWYNNKHYLINMHGMNIEMRPTICLLLNGKYVEGCGRGVISKNVPARITSFFVGTRTRYLSNTVKKIKLPLCRLQKCMGGEGL